LDTQTELQRDKNTPKKLRDATHTEISFAAKIEQGKIKALKNDESLIFTYLPTKVNDFKFPFLVNGSFLTNAAREGIHEDKIWNQWLFGLIAEKIFDWLVSLSVSKYKFNMLHLLPVKFKYNKNALMQSFNKSFSTHCCSKAFIITDSGITRKTSDVILDKTNLSNQKFIDIKSITEFINFKKSLDFDNECFVNMEVECSDKLKDIGVEVFELNNLETFFTSSFFINSHEVSDNYSLIEYFKEQSDNDQDGIFFQNIKTLSFIYDESATLCNPSNGICFPIGINSTELGNIPIIHAEVFEKIKTSKQIFSWLEKLGVQEPSQEAYVTNVIIPNIKKDDYINTGNFLKITHYLFRLYMGNKLDEEMLESLRELKLKTNKTDLSFMEAQHCFLSNEYQPQLKLEGIIKQLYFVSEDYLSLHDNKLEWNLFFKALKVKDAVEVETINENNALETLNDLTNANWVKECIKTAKSRGGFGFGDHNVVNAVKLPSFLNLTSSNLEYAKIFWGDIISNQSNILELTGDAKIKYGVGNGHNSFGCLVGNYFPWFVKNQVCIPTTTKQILKPENVFINSKEIKEIAGSYLPIFDFTTRVPNNWLQLLQFKDSLALTDYLFVLTAIALQSEDNKLKSASSIRRIGLIYNKLTSMIPSMTMDEQQIISNWAIENKLLSSNGKFEPATELKFITADGFSTESDKLKVLNVPGNCNSNMNDFKELMVLFKIQTIDEFTPLFENETIDNTLKNKIETILPYYVAIIENKTLKSSEEEFERIYRLLNLTVFYMTSEIKLSFNYKSKTFDGPSLTVYNSDHMFFFKGLWTRERTLLSLIKELANLLGVSGLNEELRFLLLESDINEIKEWLIEQGITLKLIMPVKKFTSITQVSLNDNNDASLHKEPDEGKEYEPVVLLPESGLVDTDNTCLSKIELVDIIEDVEPPVYKPFTPVTAPNNFDLTKVSAITKVFNDLTVKAESNYSKIESKEVREDVGRWCEEFVFEYLLNKKDDLTTVIWENKDAESGKPYDFKVIRNGEEKFIDVKGTPSENKDIIYLSPNEWVLMFEKGQNYSIYRVYNAGKNALIEIIDNPSSLLQQGKIFPNPITLQI